MQGQSSARLSDAVLEPLATVSARHDQGPLAARLLELRTWLADDLAHLEQSMLALPTEPLPGLRVQGAVDHLMGLAGKRIRPLCVVLAARLGGQGMNQVVRDLAVACELVHAATLLHDDVIDDSQERRGAPAARIVYGNSASILAGDHLLVCALQMVLRTGHIDLLSGLLAVSARMVAAEALQLERRGRFEPDPAAYLEVIRGKTAALFAWGLRAGGTAARLGDEVLTTLERVGTYLGMAFQLVDDMLDLAGDPQLTGKDALADIREGKLTWPIILAAERDPWVHRELVAIAGEGGAIEAVRAHQLVQRIVSTGALDATRAFARQKAAEAGALLEDLPGGLSRDGLQLVVELAVQRIL